MDKGPATVFPGKVLVLAPHMDDEVLACGGTISGLPQKEDIFIVFATDGTKSPIPIYPWLGKAATDLSKRRMREAREATTAMGVPEKNIRFLALKDGQLKNQEKRLISLLAQAIIEIEPDNIFIPFRYDRHPDHLALSRATQQALNMTGLSARVYEYFIYNRYRFLSGGDIRQYINPELLLEIDIRQYSSKKKEALLCYKSQTECLYDWQKRPILLPSRVDEVSNSSEKFLINHPNYPGATVFTRSANWIRLVHRIEPWFKQIKEHLWALMPPKKTINVR
jgi:LmbE family N-acetylglucosaminyl deacetylase